MVSIRAVPTRTGSGAELSPIGSLHPATEIARQNIVARSFRIDATPASLKWRWQWFIDTADDEFQPRFTLTP
jgi:hypothetical protein